MYWYIHVILVITLLILGSLVKDHIRDGEPGKAVFAVVVICGTVFMWIYMAFNW